MIFRSGAKPIAVFVAALFVCSGGCSRGGDSSPSSSSAGSLDVTGSLADWPGAIGSFSGYSIALVDTISQRAFRATLVDSPGFVIQDVPKNGKYVAVLLDPEYRFVGILQLSRITKKGQSKRYQVFRFGDGGSLGSLSLEGMLMRSSEQNALFPITEHQFTDVNGDGVPDGLQGTANTFAGVVDVEGDLDSDELVNSVDFDQDNDGVPNVIDTDIDGDGIPDAFDADTNQDGKVDQEASWEENPLVKVSKGGFRYVFHEVKQNADDSESVSLWPVFGSRQKKISSVKIVGGSFLEGALFSSDGSAFSGDLFDDATHGDGVEEDGVWSTPIALASGSRPAENQVVTFQVYKGTKVSEEYLMGMGPLLSGNITHAVSVDAESGMVNVTWSALGLLQEQTAILFQVLVYDADGRRVYTSGKLAHDAVSHQIEQSLFVSDVEHKVEVRAVGPSPRDGFPGSAWRSKEKTFTP